MSQQIDPRTLELIHAEVDGELDGAERAELEARCAADPAAREHREQWGRIHAALARLPSVEPPAGLGRRWQGGSPAAPERLSVVPRRSRPRRWLRPAIGLAAGGLALAIALGYGGLGRSLLDGDALVGTMGGAHAVRRVDVDAAGVTGAISLRPSGAGWTLVFDLRGEQPTPVVATWEPSALGPGALRSDPTGPWQAVPGRIAFTVAPEQHLSLDLAPGEGGQVRVRIEGAEGERQELAITVPPAPAKR
jgi:hypothetical protein